MRKAWGGVVDEGLQGAYVVTMSTSVRRVILYGLRAVGKNVPDFKHLNTLLEEAERQVKALNAVEQVEGHPPGTQFEVVKITIEPLVEEPSLDNMKKKTADMEEWINSMKKK